VARHDYKARVSRSSLLSLSTAILAGFVGAKTIQLSNPGENLWFVIPVLVLLGGLATASMRIWLRSIDDVQRDGHLSSWWWGSMTGAMVVVVSSVAIYGRESEFARGAALLWISQLVVYLLVFGIWRIRSGSADK